LLPPPTSPLFPYTTLFRSEFVVRLPLLREAPSPDAAAGSKPQGTCTVSPRRILLVDDNKDSAESLALVLRLTGHEVRTAYDGPRSEEHTSELQSRFDLVCR